MAQRASPKKVSDKLETFGRTSHVDTVETKASENVVLLSGKKRMDGNCHARSTGEIQPASLVSPSCPWRVSLVVCIIFKTCLSITAHLD